jgi:hypothetical protein
MDGYKARRLLANAYRAEGAAAALVTRLTLRASIIEPVRDAHAPRA